MSRLTTELAPLTGSQAAQNRLAWLRCNGWQFAIRAAVLQERCQCPARPQRN
ncbi:MAG: DUF4224 domain-containing protein [Chloroflexi bacterium]|nr:MAG: DUF4224 domain-containing protein [Chloroflexota bacterium]